MLTLKTYISTIHSSPSLDNDISENYSSRKNSTSLCTLMEYLTDDQRKRYKNVEMTTKAREDTDHFFGKDNDEIKEPLKDHVPDKSEVHKKVEHHLGKEIEPEEYKKGITTDKYGRQVKLGKSIKDEKLRTEFANDSTRAGTKSSKNFHVSVVRGTEVAGQTNSAPDKHHPHGHSWGGDVM